MRGARVVLAIAFASSCAFAVACRSPSGDRGDTRSEPAPAPPAVPACACGPGPVVDPTLLAYLSLARAAHHNADRAEDAKDWRKAIAALDPIVKTPIPGGERHAAPEAAEVMADTRARLADFESALGDFGGALEEIDKGLAMVPDPTYFRGHLFEIRGLVYERQAKAAKEKGDKAGEARANELAAEASDKAVEIQFEVIGRALGGLDAGK